MTIKKTSEIEIILNSKDLHEALISYAISKNIIKNALVESSFEIYQNNSSNYCSELIRYVSQIKLKIKSVEDTD